MILLSADSMGKIIPRRRHEKRTASRGGSCLSPGFPFQLSAGVLLSRCHRIKVTRWAPSLLLSWPVAIA